MGTMPGVGRSNRVNTFYVMPILFSQDQLNQIVRDAGENDSIDAKAACDWDNNVNSASLTKDILAFANTRGGGVLVIGKSESSDGSFTLTGVDEAQARSFEATTISQWVNARCEPPVVLSAGTHRYDGKLFVILSVDEFAECPVLCLRRFDKPNSREPILRESTVYVRKNVSSRPIDNAEDLRRIVALAAFKKREELFERINAIVTGAGGGLAQVPPLEAYEPEIAEMLAAKSALEHSVSGNGWTLRLFPIPYRETRWADSEALRQFLRSSADFLGAAAGYPIRDFQTRMWGSFGGNREKFVAASRSGAFILLQDYREDRHQYTNPWRTLGKPQETVPAGKWIEFVLAMKVIASFFRFAGAVAEDLEPTEKLRLEFSAARLEGRILATNDTSVSIDPSRPASRVTFSRNLTLANANIAAGWRELGADVGHDFLREFPYDFEITRKTVRDWIDRAFR